MKLSISETAALVGVSVRTLHYYDEIGILKPAEVSEAGYRFYDETALTRLQQILFYRELAFSLKDIADILSRPDYDKDDALKKQWELLLLKRRHIDELISLVERTLGGNDMTQQKVTSAAIDAAKRQYAAEVEARWGKTPAYAEWQKKHAAYREDQEVAIEEEAEALFSAFSCLMDRDPADPAVQSLVKKWQEHITKYHYSCTKEILASLGQMYTADERFKANLDRFGDGNAAFMSEAIAIYCKD